MIILSAPQEQITLGPEGTKDQHRIDELSGEKRTDTGFEARAAGDDVSDADLFSKSGDDDLKRMSGASGSFESTPDASAGHEISIDETPRPQEEVPAQRGDPAGMCSSAYSSSF